MTPPRGLDPARLPKAPRLVLACVAIALGSAAVLSRATSFAPADVVRNEFTQDYVSARALAEGADPYAPAQELMDAYLEGRDAYVIRNPHPPAQIMLVRPLSSLPYSAARAIWLIGQAIAIAAAVAITVRGLGWTRATAIVAGIGALALPVAQKELVYGNLNGFLLLMLAVAWASLRDGRETAPGSSLRSGREAAAGIAVGFAAAIKIVPVFMLVPMLRARRVRAAAWTIGVAAIVSVLGFALAGFDTVSGFRSSLDENAGYWRAAPINVSVLAVPFRWLADSRWQEGLADVPALAAALAVVLAVGCVLAAFRTPAARSGDSFLAAMPWMVLISPLAWDWYLVLALPCAVAMIAQAARRGEPPGLLAVLGIALLVVGAPPGLPEPGRPLGSATLLLGYGLPTIALLVTASSDLTRRAAAPPPA